MWASILEAAMVISFGISWPMNIAKSIQSKTAKGKSFVFLCFIFFGYACGIVGKIVAGSINYVFIFYILNFVLVGADFILYFRNRRLDKKRELSISN